MSDMSILIEEFLRTDEPQAGFKPWETLVSKGPAGATDPMVLERHVIVKRADGEDIESRWVLNEMFDTLTIHLRIIAIPEEARGDPEVAALITALNRHRPLGCWYDGGEHVYLRVALAFKLVEVTHPLLESLLTSAVMEGIRHRNMFDLVWVDGALVTELVPMIVRSDL
jgi:hypothetical protein